jgi:AraC family transcriptional regulator
MQEQLIGEIQFSLGSIDVRQYTWPKPECLDFHRQNYLFSRLLTGPRGLRPFEWRLPSSARGVSAAQISVVPPKTTVNVGFTQGEAIIVSCTLAPDYVEQATGIPDWSDQHTLRCLRLRSPLITMIFDRLAQEVYFPRRSSNKVAEAFAGTLAVEVSRCIEQSTGARRTGQLAPWQVQRVRRMLEDETSVGRLTVEEMARRCGLSPRHLMRAFKASTGMTVHQCANEILMCRAKDALRLDTVPLKVLAWQLGYSSPAAFSAAFRQAVGCSPSDFRRMSAH